MLHDSVLYKCTIDIASWDVSRRVWFRLVVAAAWLDVDDGRMDAAMKSESAVRVQPSESPVDYNNEHLSSDDCEHSHDDDRSTTQRCTGHSTRPLIVPLHTHKGRMYVACSPDAQGRYYYRMNATDCASITAHWNTASDEMFSNMRVFFARAERILLCSRGSPWVSSINWARPAHPVLLGHRSDIIMSTDIFI